MASAVDELRTQMSALCALGPLQAKWVEIAATLLKFCRTHEPAPSSWQLVGGEPFPTIGDLEIVFTATLRAADDIADDAAPVSGFASDDARQALTAHMADELRRLAVRLPDADAPMTASIVARAAVGAIDEVYGPTFLEWFRGAGEFKLVAGEAYPTLPRDPRPWVGPHRPNTPAGHLPSRDLTVVPHLRLATRPFQGVEYVLDFDSWNRMSPIGLDDHLVLAVAQPNLALDEFDLHTVEEPSRYTNRGPADPDRQARLLTDILRTAGDLRADVLVLPEYALNHDVVTHLWSTLTALDLHPALIVGGFWEPSEHGHALNEGWMCLPGPQHAQPHAFTTPPKLFPAPVGRYNEDIEAGSQVRVYMSERWSVAVLICRDALDATVLSHIADIGANLTLVPAMTDKSTTMRDLSGLVRARSQAFTVLSIGPAHWELTLPEPPPARGTRTEGAFAGPYADGNPDVAVPPTDDSNTAADAANRTGPLPGPTDRGLWTFDTAERQTHWHPIPS